MSRAKPALPGVIRTSSALISRSWPNNPLLLDKVLPHLVLEYLVLPASNSEIAVSIISLGVSKPGSPTVNRTTSGPGAVDMEQSQLRVRHSAGDLRHTSTECRHPFKICKFTFVIYFSWTPNILQVEVRGRYIPAVAE